MNSHLPLTPDQRREVNQHIKAAVKLGCKCGRKQELLFTIVELENRYGLTSDKLIEIVKEIGDLADEADKDPYSIDRMVEKMHNMGIDLDRRQFTPSETEDCNGTGKN